MTDIVDDATTAVTGTTNEGAVAEDNVEEEEEEEEDEEEAEEIARRLKEQLWADINKAQASQAAPAPILPPPAAESALAKKQDAALHTMNAILALAATDALARSTLASTHVPGTHDDTVWNVLHAVVRAGSVTKTLARSLTPVLVSLARSDTLFATMRHSNAPAIQLDKGKRKRDVTDEEGRQTDATRCAKRPHIVAYDDLQRQITDAVHVVSTALATHAPTNGSLDPSVIASLQLPLHQLFLFSMTSSAGGGPEMHALQEIGGLIQVLGVLSGIQIGPTATPTQQIPGSVAPPLPWTPQGTHPNPSVPFPDIGTAVYPCLVPSCRKTFLRLYSLRAHQRVHAVHRPFRCTHCPASFARNHDLKRHAKLHDKKAWQCAGCDKLFSRRDAIKRHMNSGAARETCVGAAVREVVLDHKEGEEEGVREGRRTRMWADMVAGSATAVPHGGDEDGVEEGEVQGEVVRRMQTTVLSLHATLQTHVSSALGTDHAAPPLHLDPTGGQATLASVIARAQMQRVVSAPALPPAPCPSQGAYPDPEGSLGMEGRTVENGTRTEAPQLSLYGLSEEQTKLLELAIANAASAAQAQAEAEAALEEVDDDDADDHEDEDEPREDG